MCQAATQWLPRAAAAFSRQAVAAQVDPALQPGAHAGRAGAGAAHPLALENGPHALVAQALLLRPCRHRAHDAGRRQEGRAPRQRLRRQAPRLTT